MIQTEIEKPVINVIGRKKRPGVIKRAAGIAAGLGIAVEYLFSGGAIYDADRTEKSYVSVGPQRELSSDREVYFPKAAFPKRGEIVLLYPPTHNESPPNESPPVRTITAADPSSRESFLHVTQTSDLTPDPIIDYAKLDNLVAKMGKRPDLFSKDFIEGIRIYYPIFEAVGAKYDIPPLLLAIIAYHETNMGENLNAYNGRSAPFYGFGQRNENIWTNTDVDKAVKGLENLKNYPQRHPDDWRESAFIGWFLYNHRLKYLHEGIAKVKALIMALGNYNNSASGEERDFEYLTDEKALGNP